MGLEEPLQGEPSLPGGESDMIRPGCGKGPEGIKVLPRPGLH